MIINHIINFFQKKQNFDKIIWKKIHLEEWLNYYSYNFFKIKKKISTVNPKKLLYYYPYCFFW